MSDNKKLSKEEVLGLVGLQVSINYHHFKGNGTSRKQEFDADCFLLEYLLCDYPDSIDDYIHLFSGEVLRYGFDAVPKAKIYYRG